MPAAGILGWNETSQRQLLELIKNTGEGINQRGTTHHPRGWGARPTPWARPLPRGPPVRPPVPIFGYMVSFVRKKIISKLTGRNSAATRRNLGGTNLGLRRSCSAGETSLREGEIITIVITIDPLSGRGSISINIFTSTISSQTLVHLLYPIFVPNPQIGTYMGY